MLSSFRFYLFFTLLASLLISSCKEELVRGKVFFNFPTKKIWKHRVNTIQDAVKYSKTFPGIEIDIVFDKKSGEYYCNHDSAIAPPQLREVFTALEENDSIYFWLDFKSANVGDVPIEKSIHHLNELLKEFDLKQRCIVETFNVTFLKILRQENFYTSFWFSTYQFNTMTDEEIEDLIKNTEIIIEDVQPSALSSHFSMYPFIKAHFNMKSLHFWTMGFKPQKHTDLIKQIQEDSLVKIILVDTETP